MHRLFARLLAVLMLVLMLTPVAAAPNTFPLEPPDTSSPRATLESFLYYSNVFVESMRVSGRTTPEAKEALERAMHCLDLSAVPPNILEEFGLESVLRLREILDRTPLPDRFAIPDNLEVSKQNVTQWRLPHTEIVIEKTAKGKQLGNFLFTAGTVDQLDEYYAKVRLVPYKDGALQGIYEEYIYAPGWMMPQTLIRALPDWMKRGYMGQAVWQWIGLILTIAAGCASLWILLKWNGKLKRRKGSTAWRLHLLIPPLSAIGVCSFLQYFIDDQINVTGMVLNTVVTGLECLFYILSAWAVLVAGNVAMHGIIATRHIKEDALDADVIRLAGRLFSFCLVFVVFYRAGNHFGLPVTTIFTSAGIASVPVALAARESLANFFGGVTIFLDRPFRAGDYIVLDNGERGEVKAVGMRSTRILTRDDILITIPNSVITNVKIINQSMPRQHFRIHLKIGVAYGSNLVRVEEILLEAAQKNPLVMKTPPPVVRLLSFGNAAIHFELLAWVIRPHDQGLLVHELNKMIYNRFHEEEIEIPYPQLDIHLQPERESLAMSKAPEAVLEK